nr:MAG TPA: hypothetical protein [Caudoviricetes sp.]
MDDSISDCSRPSDGRCRDIKLASSDRLRKAVVHQLSHLSWH